jgi:hypothetical protein
MNEQSVVCVVAIQTCKTMGIITYRDFNSDEAKKCTYYSSRHLIDMLMTLLGFPISLLLIGMIYTSTKALQFLSIPVYTIFKNLTIILIAYGEVLWFGGSVTGIALFSFGLMVLSSVIAAWADIQHALVSHGSQSHEATAKISTLNAGYIWMLINCLCTASYVLGMRKRIKLTNFKDFDSKATSGPQSTIFSLMVFSDVLQQSPHHPHPPRLFLTRRILVLREHHQELPPHNPQHCSGDDGHLGSLLRLHLLHLRLVCPRHLINHLLYGRCAQQTPDRGKRSRVFRCAGYTWKCECHCGRFREWNCLCGGEGEAEFEAEDGGLTDDESADEC